MRDQDWYCCLRQLEPAERVLAPIQEGRGLVAAGVVDRTKPLLCVAKATS